MQLSDSSSRILAGLLEARTGQQLTMSRRWRIETALSTLLRERGIATLDELITILVMGKEPSLSQQVVEALLNNETYFFRDRGPFDVLQRHALPELALKREKSKRLRIWSAGCSTGQEVYSLAMLFAEAPEQWRGWTIDILGTDVSSSCIDRARSGVFTQFEIQRGLGINQMIKWFEEVSDGWRAVEPLRKPVRFQVHNILEAAPHSGDFDDTEAAGAHARRAGQPAQRGNVLAACAGHLQNGLALLGGNVFSVDSNGYLFRRGFPR